MHEVGVASAILETVLARAEGRRVLSAGVRVGATNRVAVDSLQFGFEHVSEGTVAQAATLDVEVVPSVLSCRACGSVEEVNDPLVACPQCHSIEVEVSRQDELTLVWVKYAT